MITMLFYILGETIDTNTVTVGTSCKNCSCKAVSIVKFLNIWDRNNGANNGDPNQSPQEQSDRSLHCLLKK